MMDLPWLYGKNCLNHQSRSKKNGRLKNWLVWCRSRRKDEVERMFQVDGKEFMASCSKQAKAKTGDNTTPAGSCCDG